MAQYRLLANMFINGSYHEQGVVVDYDGVPGSTMEHIGGEKATVSDKNAPASEPVVVVQPKVGAEIPDDWKSKKGLERINLARKLGAQKTGLKADAADAFIAAEIEKRASASSIEK